MILDFYIIHLAIHEDLTDHTVKGYYYVAKDFLEFHKQTQGDMTNAVQEFLKESIYERQNVSSTLNYKKAALKRFIRFLQHFDEEKFDYNFSRLKRSTYERLPEILYDPDIERIRMIVRNSKHLESTGKLIISFAVNHGAIPNELQEIKFSDVDLQDQSIIMKRNDVERFMFLTEVDLNYLDNYLGSIDEFNLDHYLLSNDDKPISYHQLTKPLKYLSNYFRQSVTFRKLRNSFIVSCLKHNLNYIVIKNYLGIKSVKAIERYEKINVHRLRGVYELVNEMREELSIEKTVKRMSDNLTFLENYKESPSEIIKRAEIN